MQSKAELEAEARNERRGWGTTTGSNLRMDQRALMMDIIGSLPPGRAWNDEHLELVTDLTNNWAPLVCLRKVLIEAGIRARGAQMKLTEQEKELWYQYPEALAGKLGPEAQKQAREEGAGIPPFILH